MIDAFNPPEQEKGYPEPSMFGLLPAYGVYVRHAARVAFRDVEIGFAKDDTRPAVVLDRQNGILTIWTRIEGVLLLSTEPSDGNDETLVVPMRLLADIEWTRNWQRSRGAEPAEA